MNLTYFSVPIGLFFACAIGAMAPSQAAGPTADYTIKPEHTAASQDGTTTIEQYARIDADGDYMWQFWARHQDKLTLLEPEQPDYAAGFRFTNDFRNGSCACKKPAPDTPACICTIWAPQGFVAATRKPLSDLAWAYFKSLPDSRKIRRPNFHIEADRGKESTTTIAGWARHGPIAGIS